MIQYSTIQDNDPNAPVTRREFYEFKEEMYLFRKEFYEFKEEMYLFRKEFYEFKDYVYRSLDHMTEILERLDQERVFTEEGLRRSEVTVQDHEKRIIALEQAVAA